MPRIIQGAPSAELESVLLSRKYDYDYPDGLDLHPGSELHKRLKEEILTRAQESHDTMKSRHKSWNEIDRTLTAYVPLDKAEKDLKSDDARNPVSIVMPISYAALDTLLAYWMSAFLEVPYLRYEGHGPEDTLGAIMMEKIIQLHCSRLKVGLQLYTMWRDSMAYGFGVVSPTWYKKHGKRAVFKEEGVLSMLFNKFIPSSVNRTAEDAVLFEGNKLINIDPYKYLPDVNVPIDRVQDGEYVGWVENTNLMSLLSLERDDSIFNAKYLKGVPGRSQLLGSDLTNRSERYELPSPPDNKTNPVDVVHMEITLVPKDWKLGLGEYPEKWKFAIAADEVIVQAQPLGLNHNMYTVAICAPCFDGYSVTPAAELELVYGMQEVADWMISTHIHNVRKALHDMFLVDPSLVNIHDLKRPGPGKFMRMRRSAWGNAKLDQAVKQFNVVDVTKGHMADVGIIMDMANRTLGTSDSMQGILRHTSERKSATEARGAHAGGITRLEKGARIASMQAMYDIAYMFASHTQQLMTESDYVKTAGRWEEVLRNEYAVTEKHMRVRPKDIDIDYDIIPRDGSVPSGDYADTWIQLWAVAAKNEQLTSELDMIRIFKHIARMMGAKNIEEFIRKGGDVNVQTMPDEEAARQAQAGNLVSLEEFNVG